MLQLTKLILMVSGTFILSVMSLGRTGSSQEPADGDPKAREVADRLLRALGGKDSWEKARYFRFDFVVENKGKVVADFKHLWDRYTGKYRVEGQTDAGKKYVVLYQNINAKKGDVFVNAQPVQGQEKQKFLETGYERFINDSYWLLMPYKWRDPGVRLKYEGKSEGEHGQVWDKVLLTFQNVGLTPKDRYWAFVNQKSGLMDRWEYILQGGKGPATAADWLDWRQFGGIMLSTEKKIKGKPTRILFKNLAVSSSLDEKPFTSMEAAL
jgi:hypothetical protein